MEALKREVMEYVQIKDELKRLMDRKKLLEGKICAVMDKYDLNTLELPNGSNLNYKVKEVLSFTKEKSKKSTKDDE